MKSKEKMPDSWEKQLEEQLIQALLSAKDALRRGNRVELIPTKDGVKVLEIHRKELSKKPLLSGKIERR